MCSCGNTCAAAGTRLQLQEHAYRTRLQLQQYDLSYRNTRVAGAGVATAHVCGCWNALVTAGIQSVDTEIRPPVRGRPTHAQADARTTEDDQSLLLEECIR